MSGGDDLGSDNVLITAICLAFDKHGIRSIAVVEGLRRGVRLVAPYKEPTYPANDLCPLAEAILLSTDNVKHRIGLLVELELRGPSDVIAAKSHAVGLLGGESGEL